MLASPEDFFHAHKNGVEDFEWLLSASDGSRLANDRQLIQVLLDLGAAYEKTDKPKRRRRLEASRALDPNTSIWRNRFTYGHYRERLEWKESTGKTEKYCSLSALFSAASS
ncbi:hypothetical protein D3H35_28070 [Cohnella faecalis]|uniref:Uncharacterized protein n=1 Tax=Cohnella faecalis TaxID=2315694 RepID=A0A398CF37_9BACL|nr:hypothetical protein D3H35_28070 [Cohnella faecalis]